MSLEIYIPKRTNENIAKCRIKQNEYQRQIKTKTAWKITKQQGNILIKFVRSSFLNNNFYNDKWIQDIYSIDKRYKSLLKSQQISRDKNNKYIYSWNTTINTLINIHKNKCNTQKNYSENKCEGTLNILDITSVNYLYKL